MSVLYDLDPGRLEVYRPRADGLLGRSFCGSVLFHLVVACLLLTVHFPHSKPPPPRHYRITEVTLLPPQPAPAPAPQKMAEKLGPRDLSLFLDDFAPALSRRHHRSRRHSHRHSARSLMPAVDTVAREVKPEAPEPGDVRRSNLGPMLAEGLPNLLERPMSESRPIAPTLPPAGVSPARSAASPAPHPAASRKRAAAARRPARIAPVRHTLVEAPRQSGGGDQREAAPQSFQVARAERPRPLSDLSPAERDPGNRSKTPSSGASPSLLPPSLPADQPAELPVQPAASGKKLAQLPGDLFGSGSGQGAGASHKAAAMPEGRSGAAAMPGPSRPRVRRGKAGFSSAIGGGEPTGINPIPAAGGVRLHADERPGTIRSGAPSDAGDLGGKGLPVASLPSFGSQGSGSGSGASAAGSGAGGGYGADGPRAVGGLSRPGRPTSHAPARIQAGGDGSGGGAGAGGLNGIPAAGDGIGGSSPSHGGGAGEAAGGDRAPGKRMARGDVPFDGAGDTGHGLGHGSGSGDHAGPGLESGPQSFPSAGKHKGGSLRDGGSSSRHRRQSAGDEDGDAGGVSVSGGGGDNEAPTSDAGDGDSDTGFQRGRTPPAGAYVSTTGRFTLPGVIHDGDYHYNSEALRIMIDEINDRTKKRMRLSLRYESIARGSFQNAPVVVFTGHQAFELTDEQRQVLKKYVADGGMIWADFSHSRPFEDSFRNEMEQIFGSRPVSLPLSHPIYRSFYVLHRVPPGDLGGAESFEGISVGGRLGVVITPNRYFSAVGRSLNTSEEVQEGATQAVVNIYMYAAGNYKALKDAGE